MYLDEFYVLAAFPREEMLKSTTGTTATVLKVIEEITVFGGR